MTLFHAARGGKLIVSKKRWYAAQPELPSTLTHIKIKFDVLHLKFCCYLQNFNSVWSEACNFLQLIANWLAILRGGITVLNQKAILWIPLNTNNRWYTPFNPNYVTKYLSYSIFLLDELLFATNALILFYYSTRNYSLLSFGDEAEEDEEELDTASKVTPSPCAVTSRPHPSAC